MMQASRKISIIALIVTVFLVSCSTIPEPFGPPPLGAHPTAVFYSRWVDYLGQYDYVALQDGCRPSMVEPNPAIPYRGTVVLVHAYNACPQQFAELAELLSLRGYRSMLVLLPGHGRVQAGTLHVGQLPSTRDWRKRYEAFAKSVNDIVVYADGERIIGGNSTGAAVSLLINSGASTLYDRHITWVPFFDVAKQASSVDEEDILPDDADETNEAANDCLAGRAAGRAGYCGTSAADAEVQALLGQEAFQAVTAGSITAAMQFVVSEDDAVVSNDSILTAAASLEQVSVCMYPSGVPHSMVSQFDNPGVDMYWLDSLLNGAIDFISDGRPFPVQPGRSAQDSVLAECALLTERTD